MASFENFGKGFFTFSTIIQSDFPNVFTLWTMSQGPPSNTTQQKAPKHASTAISARKSWGMPSLEPCLWLVPSASMASHAASPWGQTQCWQSWPALPVEQAMPRQNEFLLRWVWENSIAKPMAIKKTSQYFRPWHIWCPSKQVWSSHGNLHQPSSTWRTSTGKLGGDFI